MRIWIEAKNPATQNKGVSKWFEPLILDLFKRYPNEITLVYPKNTSFTPYSSFAIARKTIFFSKILPRKLSNLLYDLFLFRIYAKFSRPDLIISPYYDVLMPKKIRSLISIHDLCFFELPKKYGYLRRTYFLTIMKVNSKRASRVLTVSETSKSGIISFLNISIEKIMKIPNFIDPDLLSYIPTLQDIENFRLISSGYEYSILYSGGLENRKNVPLLIKALAQINESNRKIALLVTGKVNKQWSRVLEENCSDSSFVYSLGDLTSKELKIAYISVNGVVYPSLSEGFGRPCLESMLFGTPLVCSDLPVFHEIVGDYPIYFNPYRLEELKSSIEMCVKVGRVNSKAEAELETFTDQKAEEVRRFIIGQ